MKSFHFVLCLVLVPVALSCLYCSKCGSDIVGEFSGEAPGEALSNAAVQVGSAALEWERVPLGLSEAAFKQAVADLFQEELSVIEELFQCGTQQGIWVIDPVGKAVQERTTKGKLHFCNISSVSVEASLRVASIRGEFLDDKLLQLQFKFTASHFNTLKAELEKRFDKGDRRDLAVDSVVGKKTESFLLWKVKNITWGINNVDKEVTLFVQDTAALSGFSVKAPNKKTDLSDIGLNGSPYDVALDDIEVPQELRDTDAPASIGSSDTDSPGIDPAP